MSVIIYLLPLLLIFVGVYLIICVVKRNKRGIVRALAIILISSVALVFYYYPSDNILGKYNFDSIRISGRGLGDIEITSSNDVNRILKVINKHTFIRSAVRTVERGTFPGSELIRLDMCDPKMGDIIHLYVLDETFEKNVLQINDHMYNVRDKEGLSKGINKVLNELNLLD